MAVSSVGGLNTYTTIVTGQVVEFDVTSSGAAEGDLIVLHWFAAKSYVYPYAPRWTFLSGVNGDNLTSDFSYTLEASSMTYIQYTRTDPPVWSGSELWATGIELAFWDGVSDVRVRRSIAASSLNPEVNLTFWRGVKQAFICSNLGMTDSGSGETPAHSSADSALWTSFLHTQDVDADWAPVSFTSVLGTVEPDEALMVGYDNTDTSHAAFVWDAATAPAEGVWSAGFTVGLSETAAVDPPPIPEPSEAYAWQPIYPVNTYHDMPGTTLDDMALMMEHNNATIEDHLSTVIPCDCEPDVGGE